MNDNPQKLMSKWDEALTRNDFEEGLATAFAGCQWAVANGDSLHKKAFVSFMKIAIDELFKASIGPLPSDSRQDLDAIACSFCSRKFDGKEMVQGVNAAICSGCVKLAGEVFSSRE
jgi:hypothetical protein